MPLEIERLIRSYLIPHRCDGRYFTCLLAIKKAKKDPKYIYLGCPAAFIHCAKRHAKTLNNFWNTMYVPHMPKLALESRRLCHR